MHAGWCQSGSKAKILRRIFAYVDKERLQAAQDIAKQGSEEGQRDAEGKVIAHPPEDDREFPCISFDLCFAKADDSTLASVMEADPKVKLVCLVVADPGSGYVQQG